MIEIAAAEVQHRAAAAIIITENSARIGSNAVAALMGGWAAGCSSSAGLQPLRGTPQPFITHQAFQAYGPGWRSGHFEAFG